ncbi:MAG: WecB/TagA/CpsF family glycosyltransferase [Methylomonas sp.]
MVTCLSDKELRDINNRSFVTMDGLPLVWYAKRVHGADVSRVCGPDLMLKCLDQGRNMGWKHFFLGGRQEVLDDLVAAMQKRYPDVDIVGWHSPPFRQLSEDEDNQLVELINNAKPDFLWVGLGAPKQEKWIAAHLDKIHVPVQLGVGAAFNFHSGHVMRAPLWMQKNGLEWLYRMFKDKRLIKRYLATNPVFLSLFARDLLVFRLLKRKVA